ncbi:MAG: DNA topoisomerase IV subunit A [Bacilli bacterium]|nr:DNA topoisomerase IV subunit A [Bacilli bacterium]
MKKEKSPEIVEKIFNYTLEEIMGQRFGRYSKYIIQDRAIPDVRDGLKPVQRRILYGMYRDRNTYDKPYRKSAKTVGNVMGNYHPHGDSSIYDAMIRMSQWWKQNTPYIDMHGNNGSMDGDSPAAMRYTEARLSKISNELLRDLDKDTVSWAPNFDDTELEPTVLPARFPNLLVNGTSGISAGYATNIPPHNLGEIIDATIKRIDSPNCRLETIMSIVKGPDFPTGGIVEGIKEIERAYETGKGKIVVKSKTEFEESKGKLALIVTEIPFEVNKAMLVRKMDEIRIDKKIEGILEVRDESDREGLRIAIDLKKDVNRDLVLNYLLKNTDLQISYSFNMIAIDHRRPKLLGILDVLDSYIQHQREVILKRTHFDLAHAKARLHIVEGLIKCLSILDEVIRVIRASKNKADARDNLVKEFDFTVEQAEAIITLQLYRLTNTDVVQLEEELANLKTIVTGLEAILADEEKLKGVMKDELRKVKHEYAVPRKTEIKDEITEIKIDTTVMLPKEDVIVSITKDGYVKRTSLRSYQASCGDEVALKETDYMIGLYELNTLDTILLFTSLGNYLYVPIHTIPDMKWKDLGKHISNLIKLEEKEEIVFALPVIDFDKEIDITIITKKGMIKRTPLKEFQVSRYSKPVSCMKLKDGDLVVSVFETKYDDIFLSTTDSYGLWFSKNDVPIVGLKASGVKAISLKTDTVTNGSNFDPRQHEHLLIVTDKGTGKRVKITEFEKSTRARRGLLILREVKSNPYKIIKAYPVSSKDHVGLKSSIIQLFRNTEFPIMDRYSTGSNISKEEINDCFLMIQLVKKNQLLADISDTTLMDSIETTTDAVSEVEPIEQKDKKKISIKEIDDRLMTIDDFLKD